MRDCDIINSQIQNPVALVYAIDNDYKSSANDCEITVVRTFVVYIFFIDNMHNYKFENRSCS